MLEAEGVVYFGLAVYCIYKWNGALAQLGKDGAYGGDRHAVVAGVDHGVGGVIDIGEEVGVAFTQFEGLFEVGLHFGEVVFGACFGPNAVRFDCVFRYFGGEFCGHFDDAFVCELRHPEERGIVRIVALVGVFGCGFV